MQDFDNLDENNSDSALENIDEGQTSGKEMSNEDIEALQKLAQEADAAKAIEINMSDINSTISTDGDDTIPQINEDESGEVFEDSDSKNDSIEPSEQKKPPGSENLTIRDVLKAQMNDDSRKESTVIADTSISLGEIIDKKYDEVVTVQPVRFTNFESDEYIVGPPRKNLDIMQDVHIKITVELGRTKMKVKKLLDITDGTIIEINKVAGEQAELFVCGKLVAFGEVIVIEDKFGLKITSIIESKPDE